MTNPKSKLLNSKPRKIIQSKKTFISVILLVAIVLALSLLMTKVLIKVEEKTIILQSQNIANPFADLKIENIWIDTAPNPKESNSKEVMKIILKAHKVYYLHCQYSNIGQNLKGEDWKLIYLIDDRIVGIENCGDVPAGQTQIKTFRGSLVTGAGEVVIHQYKCILDYENKVLEQNKDNNKMVTQFKASKL